MVIASEHLSPDTGRDRGSKPLRFVGIERPDQLGVAARAIDDVGADVDLTTGAVLPAAAAPLAQCDRDLIGRPLGAGAALQCAAAQDLDQRTVVELSAVLIGHRALGLAEECEGCGRELEPQRALGALRSAKGNPRPVAPRS